jgi:hypothetical protein
LEKVLSPSSFNKTILSAIKIRGSYGVRLCIVQNLARVLNRRLGRYWREKKKERRRPTYRRSRGIPWLWVAQHGSVRLGNTPKVKEREFFIPTLGHNSAMIDHLNKQLDHLINNLKVYKDYDAKGKSLQYIVKA